MALQLDCKGYWECDALRVNLLSWTLASECSQGCLRTILHCLACSLTWHCVSQVQQVKVSPDPAISGLWLWPEQAYWLLHFAGNI